MKGSLVRGNNMVTKRNNANIINYFEWWDAEGVVYGKLWGGGRSFYTARSVQANNFEELSKIILKYLDDGGLDSGMGYQELIVAPMQVTKSISITVDSNRYKIDKGIFRSKEIVDTFIFGDKKGLSDYELQGCYEALDNQLIEGEFYNGEVLKE